MALHHQKDKSSRISFWVCCFLLSDRQCSEELIEPLPQCFVPKHLGAWQSRYLQMHGNGEWQSHRPNRSTTVYSWKSPCHWPRTTTLVEATDLRHRKFGHRGMALGLAGNAEKAAANMCWGDSCHFSFELSEAGAGNGWQRGILSKEIPRASFSQGSSLPIPNH